MKKMSAIGGRSIEKPPKADPRPGSMSRKDKEAWREQEALRSKLKVDSRFIKRPTAGEESKVRENLSAENNSKPLDQGSRCVLRGGARWGSGGKKGTLRQGWGKKGGVGCGPGQKERGIKNTEGKESQLLEESE